MIYLKSTCYQITAHHSHDTYKISGAQDVRMNGIDLDLHIRCHFSDANERKKLKIQYLENQQCS